MLKHNTHIPIPHPHLLAEDSEFLGRAGQSSFLVSCQGFESILWYIRNSVGHSVTINWLTGRCASSPNYQTHISLRLQSGLLSRPWAAVLTRLQRASLAAWPFGVVRWLWNCAGHSLPSCTGGLGSHSCRYPEWNAGPASPPRCSASRLPCLD